MNNIDMEIPQLYKLKASDREKLIKTYMSAFREYPKLMNVFPDNSKRLCALEATLRYYTSYDLRYGSGFSIDENVNEAVLAVHSSQMHYSFLRHLRAGSYSHGYRAAMKKLSGSDRRMRIELFKELDLLEKTITVPSPHIYVDFLGVTERYQHQGRGRKLMSHLCRYADIHDIPLMLFTNTAEDIRFYQSLGFDIIGKTSSEKFGFVNIYLLYGTGRSMDDPSDA